MSGRCFQSYHCLVFTKAQLQTFQRNENQAMCGTQGTILQGQLSSQLMHTILTISSLIDQE